MKAGDAHRQCLQAMWQATESEGKLIAVPVLDSFRILFDSVWGILWAQTIRVPICVSAMVKLYEQDESSQHLTDLPWL